MLSEGNLWKDPLFVAYLGASIVSVIIIHHDLPPPLLPMVLFVPERLSYYRYFKQFLNRTLVILTSFVIVLSFLLLGIVFGFRVTWRTEG